MNIGLLPVDSSYPNLALMKISAWHKQQGDCVEWYNPFDHYDKLYMSKVFLFTEDYLQYITNADCVEKGVPVDFSKVCSQASFSEYMSQDNVEFILPN